MKISLIFYPLRSTLYGILFFMILPRSLPRSLNCCFFTNLQNYGQKHETRRLFHWLNQNNSVHDQRARYEGITSEIFQSGQSYLCGQSNPEWRYSIYDPSTNDQEFHPWLTKRTVSCILSLCQDLCVSDFL